MPPVDPLSGFNGIRLSPDAVIAKHRAVDLLLRLNPRKAITCSPAGILELAGAYREKKECALAIQLLKRLLGCTEVRNPRQDHHYRLALFFLGICCHNLENYNEADGWYHLYLAHPVDDIFLEALARGNLADTLSHLDRFEEAEVLFNDSLAVLKAMFSQAYPSCPYYHMLYNYASLLSLMNREEEAAAARKEAQEEEELFWYCWVRCT